MVTKARSHSPDIAINDCLISSLEDDCTPLTLIEGGDGSSTLNCGLYKDYPNYLGCSKGRGFTTYTDGNERIKYESYHVSSSCRVQFQVHAVSQNRFLRIWWDESRPLRGYAAEKVKYLLWDGTPGETSAESGIIERTTSHLYIPVWVVPRSQCTTSNGTYRCYGSDDRHYEVDAYWFWIDDQYGAGTRIQECDKSQVCTGDRCPDPFSGRPNNICNDCPVGDYFCLNGNCIPINW